MYQPKVYLYALDEDYKPIKTFWLSRESATIWNIRTQAVQLWEQARYDTCGTLAGVYAADECRNLREVFMAAKDVSASPESRVCFKDYLETTGMKFEF